MARVLLIKKAQPHRQSNIRVIALFVRIALTMTVTTGNRVYEEPGPYPWEV